jgi:hypothetical protein
MGNSFEGMVFEPNRVTYALVVATPAITAFVTAIPAGPSGVPPGPSPTGTLMKELSDVLMTVRLSET